MRKFLLGCAIFLVLFFGTIFGYQCYQLYRVKHAKIEVVLKKDLTVSFLEQKRISEFIESINGNIIGNGYVDTKKLGRQTITFSFLNDDNIKVKYSFEIEVIDTTAPVVWLSDVYKVKVGSSDSFAKKILCGDDTDTHPTCLIEGDYNLNKVGDYPVTFKATDKSGNTTVKEFTLRVYQPKSSTGTSKPTYLSFQDLVAKHKTEKTEIGLDVSKWQGNIDFDKIKKEGVEFIFIRVGTMTGTDGEYILDSKFKRNIEEANRVGIKVGIYFYSYSNTVEGARKDAEWVVSQIKPYKVDLPVVFDWEDWSDFNNYHMSFFGLTSMAEEFFQVVEDYGYEGMLYSSKYFLEQIWLPTEYPIWLAHYTNYTNPSSYEGEYEYWQMCSDGKIDGIAGAVDVNVRYLK